MWYWSDKILPENTLRSNHVPMQITLLQVFQSLLAHFFRNYTKNTKIMD